MTKRELVKELRRLKRAFFSLENALYQKIAFDMNNRDKWLHFWESLQGEDKLIECVKKISEYGFADNPARFCKRLQSFLEGSSEPLLTTLTDESANRFASNGPVATGHRYNLRKKFSINRRHLSNYGGDEMLDREKILKRLALRAKLLRFAKENPKLRSKALEWAEETQDQVIPIPKEERVHLEEVLGKMNQRVSSSCACGRKERLAKLLAEARRKRLREKLLKERQKGVSVSPLSKRRGTLDTADSTLEDRVAEKLKRIAEKLRNRYAGAEVIRKKAAEEEVEEKEERKEKKEEKEEKEEFIEVPEATPEVTSEEIPTSLDNIKEEKKTPSFSEAGEIRLSAIFQKISELIGVNPEELVVTDVAFSNENGRLTISFTYPTSAGSSILTEDEALVDLKTGALKVKGQTSYLYHIPTRTIQPLPTFESPEMGSEYFEIKPYNKETETDLSMEGVKKDGKVELARDLVDKEKEVAKNIETVASLQKKATLINELLDVLELKGLIEPEERRIFANKFSDQNIEQIEETLKLAKSLGGDTLFLDDKGKVVDLSKLVE